MEILYFDHWHFEKEVKTPNLDRLQQRCKINVFLYESLARKKKKLIRQNNFLVRSIQINFTWPLFLNKLVQPIHFFRRDFNDNGYQREDIGKKCTHNKIMVQER